jgi:hypothetical protein
MTLQLLLVYGFIWYNMRTLACTQYQPSKMGFLLVIEENSSNFAGKHLHVTDLS